MRQLTYRAVDGSGIEQKGQIAAESTAVAVQQLAEKGLTALSLTDEGGRTPAPAGKSDRRLPPRLAAVLLVRELSSLLRAGVTLEESLRTTLESRHGSPQAAPLSAVLESVLSGQRFSAALVEHANVPALSLPAYVVALVSAGESTGDLAAALNSAAEQLEFDERIRAETSEALVYPFILVSAGAAAVLFVFSFVVPRFSSLLAGKKVELHWLSAIVLGTGDFFNSHATAIVLGLSILVATAIAVGRWLGPQRIRSMLSRWPLVGPWLRQQELSRWTGMLALMLQSRVPILTALDLTAAAVGLPEVRRRLQLTMNDVGSGGALSTSFAERQLLPATALSMVRVGERTGQLGAMMGHVASFALEANRRASRRLVTLIEPAAILLLGGIIAVVVVGVVLALASLTEVDL